MQKNKNIFIKGLAISISQIICRMSQPFLKMITFEFIINKTPS